MNSADLDYLLSPQQNQRNLTFADVNRSEHPPVQPFASCLKCKVTDSCLFTFHRAIVALVYNVLKAFMEMNSAMFDELTATYKSDRQR